MERRIEPGLEPRLVEEMERGAGAAHMMECARTVVKLLDYDAKGAEQALREVCRRVRIGRGPESAIGGRVYG